VLYADQDVHGAFIETYGQKLDLRVLSPAELASRCASAVHALTSQRLVNLTGRASPGSERMSASARVHIG
jgi:hypothetical protein